LNPGSKSVRAPADSRLILGSPVARALALIGDRWAHLIIRDAFLGVRRFEDFRRRTGAARGTLASRLKTFVEKAQERRSARGRQRAFGFDDELVRRRLRGLGYIE